MSSLYSDIKSNSHFLVKALSYNFDGSDGEYFWHLLLDKIETLRIKNIYKVTDLQKNDIMIFDDVLTGL